MALHGTSLLITSIVILFVGIGSQNISNYVVNCDNSDSRIIIDDSSTETIIEAITIPINAVNPPCYLHISLLDTGYQFFEDDEECTMTFQLKQSTMTPTSYPTWVPTSSPTWHPTTGAPTEPPTTASSQPTSFPSSSPTSNTIPPTSFPTTSPATDPTTSPTDHPTTPPSIHPTKAPTNQPTKYPTINPTKAPTTLEPTSVPTLEPTSAPTTGSPTATTNPTVSPQPAPAPTYLGGYQLTHIFNLNNQNIFWRNYLHNESHHSFEFFPGCDTSKDIVFAELDVSSTNQTAHDMWSLVQNRTDNLSGITVENPSGNTQLFPFEFSVYTGDVTSTELNISIIDTTTPSITCYYGDVFDLDVTDSIDYYLFVSAVNVDVEAYADNMTLDVIITTECVSITTTETPISTTIQHESTTETLWNTTDIFSSFSSMYSTTADSYGFDEIELEFIISISVVGFILLVVSIGAVIYLCRHKNTPEEEQHESSVPLSPPDDIAPIDVDDKHPLAPISETAHQEMLELARKNSLSTGLQ